MEKDNEQLVSDYLGGDEEAFEHLVKKNLNSVYGLVFRLTHDKALTEDIVQETFTKVWKKLDKYDKAKKFKPWLFVITHNTAIDFLRQNRNFNFSDFDNPEEDTFFQDSLMDDEPLADEIFSKIEEIEELKRTIGELAPFYQEILVLRYFEELSFDEIGLILNKTQFLVEAISLTLVGGIIGITLGWVISCVVNWTGLVSTSVSFVSVVLAFGVSAIIGIIFGYYPAKRAASLNPIEALRYE